MNTKRMNRLEELGRVDAEHAETSTGRRNLADEKRRVVKELRHPHHSSHIEEMGSAYENHTASGGPRMPYHAVVEFSRKASTKELK
jgi:hypothetical protein